MRTSALFATDGGELCNNAVMHVISTPTHFGSPVGSVARYLLGIEEKKREEGKGRSVEDLAITRGM